MGCCHGGVVGGGCVHVVVRWVEWLLQRQDWRVVSLYNQIWLWV